MAWSQPEAPLGERVEKAMLAIPKCIRFLLSIRNSLYPDETVDEPSLRREMKDLQAGFDFIDGETWAAVREHIANGRLLLRTVRISVPGCVGGQEVFAVQPTTKLWEWEQAQAPKGRTVSAEHPGASIDDRPQHNRDEQSDDQATSGMTWQEVAERLERLRTQGERFTSQPKLADQLGTSPSTVNKAIQRTPSLQAWAKRPDAEPKAQSLTPHNKKSNGWTDIVIDRTAQSHELNPLDDAAIREFIERADPEAKSWFLALSPEDQLQVVNDPDKHTRILGRKP